MGFCLPPSSSFFFFGLVGWLLLLLVLVNEVVVIIMMLIPSSRFAQSSRLSHYGHRLRHLIANSMDPVLNIFRATDELDAPGIPKKTKDDLENFCNYATDYCLSYVNEPSVGLWHIQNHIHDKILPKNNQMKSKLLETLQECREVSLELDSAIEHTHIWKTDGDNKGESDVSLTPLAKVY